MPRPPKDPDSELNEVLQDLPPETEELAREFGAFVKGKKIKNIRQLLRVIFLYSGLDKSLRQVAGTLTALQGPITDEAVRKRLKAAVPFVKALLPRMLSGAKGQELWEGLRLLVIDGSMVKGPGAKGQQYRLHICMDLMSLEILEVTVTDQHTGESLKNFDFVEGDTVIADRGYCHLEVMIDTLNSGVGLITRVNYKNLPLHRPEGTEVKLAEELSCVEPGQIKSFEVILEKGQKQCRGWIHAYRLPPDKADEARRRCRRYYQKKGTAPTEETLFMSEWVIVFSSVAPDVIDAKAILSLYRLRWQVELLIKRWKSVLDLDALRSRQNTPQAELWIHGKLLYVLLIDKKTRSSFGDEWSFLNQARVATFWRPWVMTKDKVDPCITGSRFWKDGWAQSSLGVLAERPRKRKLQTLPAELAWKPNGAAGQLHPLAHVTSAHPSILTEEAA